VFGTEMDFQKRAARPSRLLKVRNKVVREKIGVTQFNSERIENAC